MNSNSPKKDRRLTVAVVILSLAGIIYFGFQAISDDSSRNQENPFEYNIDHFKNTDGDLHKFREVRQIQLNSGPPVGIAIDSDNLIFISGNNSVTVFEHSGELHSRFSTTGTARALAAAQSGLYLAMETNVDVYDRDGNRLAQWQDLGADALLTSIAVSDEAVYVADAGNLIVWKYDHSGSLLGRIGDRDPENDIPGFIIPSPYFDVAIDTDGFLWAANTGRHQLENYTTDGKLRSVWGEAGMDLAGFSGCCNPIHFALLPDGSFVTSEKGIARVKVYNQIGELKALVAIPGQFVDGTEGLDLAFDSDQRVYVLDPVQNRVRIFDRN